MMNSFIIKKIVNIAQYLQIRCYCSSNHNIKTYRNIGILAHIDAGKTTTTERMLYYSGRIHQMGEVHHGNTVTDYMLQERERGITIRSAAVTFNWKHHQFNLIDTPGHIDFTIEVEETMSVLDGGIVILDGSAGVEAQTLTVWKQADRHRIPRIVFVNKMDRADGNLKLSCNSIEEKLEIPAIYLQLPIVQEGKLIGLIDVLTLEKILPNEIAQPLCETKDPQIWNDAKEARGFVIDKLTDFNDTLANIVINSDSLDNISTADIQKALRQVTLEQKAVPVFCGSAYKNIGVQSLMDSVILYLPAPDETNTYFNCFKENLSARAFKIIHDKQKGPLVFFRIYSGIFNKGQKIYNISQAFSEQTGKLYIAYADEFQEIEKLENGNIAVVSGLKKTILGDLVTQSGTTANHAKKEMIKFMKDEHSNTDTDLVNKIFGTGAKIPEPVFFCSIEPPSLAYQNSLEQALLELQREDPSLRVANDSETGQIVLAGMGELHLDIIKDRVLKEYKIKADLGPLQIAYHETPINRISDEFVTETKVGNSKHIVSTSISIIPGNLEDCKEILKLDKSPEAASNLANLHPKHLLAVKQGVAVGLSHGPKIHSQVVDTQVILHRLEIGRGTSNTIISACITQAIQKLLQKSGVNILEPVMALEIVIPDELVAIVLADLSRRRTKINNVTVRGKGKVINCETPLSELKGYSTTLRTITSGTASFTMEFLQYKIMSPIDEQQAIESIRGF